MGGGERELDTLKQMDVQWERERYMDIDTEYERERENDGSNLIQKVRKRETDGHT